MVEPADGWWVAVGTGLGVVCQILRTRVSKRRNGSGRPITLETIHAQFTEMRQAFMARAQKHSDVCQEHTNRLEGHGKQLVRLESFKDEVIPRLRAIDERTEELVKGVAGIEGSLRRMNGDRR